MNASTFRFAFTAALAAVALALPAAAASKVTPTGRRTLDKLAQDSMAEIQVSKLAEQNASNQQVKDFAKKMVDDHQSLLNDVRSTAQHENVTLPTSVTAKQKADADRLQKLSGADFDREYMTMQLKDHHTDVSTLKTDMKKLQNPAIEQVAQKALPVLESHARDAEQTAAAIGVSTSTHTMRRSGAERSSQGK